jgi:energy-coupling factor transporter transmembrane protein EcfT
MTSGVLFAGPFLLVLLLPVLVAFLQLEGLKVRRLLTELPLLAILIVTAIALQTIGFEHGIRLDTKALGESLLYSARLMAAWFSGRLFYQSTSSSELREAASSVGKILPGRLGADMGLALSLMLGFIPGIVGEWKLSVEAARARGLGQKPRLRLIVEIIAAFIRRLVVGALVLPEILVARGWTGRSAEKGRGWGGESWAILAFAAAIMVLSVFK